MRPRSSSIDEAPVLFVRNEILAADNDGCAEAPRLPLQNGEGVLVLLGEDRGHTALENTGFLDSDFFDRVAQKFRMIDRYRRDDRQCGPCDDIGRIDASAEADFQQKHVRRSLGKEQERRRRRDLEKRDRLRRHWLFAALKRRLQRRVRYQDAAAVTTDTDSLVEVDQMRRGVDVHALAGSFQHRAHEGDGRSLAVGPGDVDHRRQARFRMAKTCKKPLDPAERQIDTFRVQI